MPVFIALMDLYALTEILELLWEKSEALYRRGNREPSTYFTKEETAALNELGLETMDVYDYVEDFVTEGEPDYGTFLLISAERVFYFHDVLGGIPAAHKINEDDLPPKEGTLEGIEWLPRILAKARGKLEGTLPDAIMFGCGGDRKFLRESNIHPAEFLRKIGTSGTTGDVVAWVVERRKQAISSH